MKRRSLKAEASAREPVRVTFRKRARESLDGALSTNPITNSNAKPIPENKTCTRVSVH